MKRKEDFVTNSSSCSFIAWGLTMSINDIKEKCGPAIFKLYKESEEKSKDKSAKKAGAFIKVNAVVDQEKLKKEYETFLEEFEFDYQIDEYVDLNCRCMPYEDYVMMGKSPFDISDDQTLIEFKQSICDKFKTLGLDLKPDDLYQIEEAWMDN